LVSPPGNIWLARRRCVLPKMAKMRHLRDLSRLIETLLRRPQDNGVGPKTSSSNREASSKARNELMHGDPLRTQSAKARNELMHGDPLRTIVTLQLL